MRTPQQITFDHRRNSLFVDGDGQIVRGDELSDSLGAGFAEAGVTESFVGKDFAEAGVTESFVGDDDLTEIVTSGADFAEAGETESFVGDELRLLAESSPAERAAMRRTSSGYNSHLAYTSGIGGKLMRLVKRSLRGDQAAAQELRAVEAAPGGGALVQKMKEKLQRRQRQATPSGGRKHSF